ncbi:MAG: tRNA (adenosine(37)-N6)-threonylcarbamoyltransferase complex ATPase subunit type 1 TsaE [Candidatus Marinimicrobia bacterium]|nr:tRNA (adenosine(37)-N6)-threonylcarbamoyltransferase complex ATPase subunit type 1 TsaE [Candidatus Neomarinimicrobiota bacterium]|tara:strand:- start:72 stop:485 length:414 start_codon:yes stop_codon:yes gene_type:complete
MKNKYKTNSDLETQEIGKIFSKEIVVGDVILLFGDLGAGKTTFVKGLLKGLKFDGVVTSPTFSLVNEYNALMNVIHIDCYREKNKQRWINIGLEDYFNNSNLVIIEWPEIIMDIIPKNTIKVNLKHIDKSTREVFFS